MKIFLELKSWQIFSLFIIGAFQLMFFIQTDFWFVSFILFYGLQLGWVYSIGKILNKDNIEELNRLKNWTRMYMISLILIGTIYRNMIAQSMKEYDAVIMILSVILGIPSFISMVVIAAKSIKESEGDDDSSFGKYAPEFFLIIYMAFGVWFIQPRLNKLMEEEKNDK